MSNYEKVLYPCVFGLSVGLSACVSSLVIVAVDSDNPKSIKTSDTMARIGVILIEVSAAGLSINNFIHRKK